MGTPQTEAGLTHAEAMDHIFERFFNRSPEHGYSFAEFKADALTTLDAARTESDARIAELERVMDAIATDVESAAGTFWPSYHVIKRVAEPLRAALSSSTGEPNDSPGDQYPYVAGVNVIEDENR